MGDFIRKNGLVLAAVVLGVAALIFYVVVVRTAGGRRAKLISDVRKRHQDLKEAASRIPHPNPDDIERVRQAAEESTRRTENALGYFLRQRRDGHTRRFYTAPYAPQRKQISLAFEWNEEYLRRAERLAKILQEAGIGTVGLSLPRYTGAGLPDNIWITRAMLVYWLHKDLVDLLTNREPQNVEEYLRNQGDVGVKTLYDLVRNRNPREPRTTLVRLVREGRLSHKDLKDLLKDILWGEDGWHLKRLLSRYPLRPDAAVLQRLESGDLSAAESAVLKKVRAKQPLDAAGRETFRRLLARRNALQTVWDAVKAQVITSTQRTVLDDLARDKDYRRLCDFANDLRFVRYRSDLQWVFENRGETALVDFIKHPAEMKGKLATLIDASPEWDLPRVARIIGAVYSIADERTYEAFLKNHGTPWIRLTGLQVSTTAETAAAFREEVAAPEEMEPGRPGVPEPGTGAQPAQPTEPFPVVNDIYYAIPFKLTVNIEFQQIPAFLRRLYQLDWCIQINSLDVLKTAGAATTTVELRRRPEEPMEEFEEPPFGEPPPEEETGPVEARAQRQRIVSLQLSGVAHSFYPLIREREKKESQRQP